ncbi:host-nuclease inhibitor Gam family protein [Pullulanibacillus sp. KACC 23026]|uniref:host-nuclease inhibitor Gam family protein n=1 Tax=Pullulanibacillus sp. KACC 23026 TaxID=3028315 RepID=UPI0023B12F59|nr:host-nuclease inhibitor Gam family protein [Pullulanibacillus sp. KACC 23026]WEG13973.1 host-nuclease inhibitor Gam family protein [Pullulanibacillus sp. KACC 23026]
MLNPLEKIEIDVLEVFEEEVVQKFEIKDLESLNWSFRKLSALKSKEKEIKTLANVERDRIAQWEQGELSTISSSLEFFENLISEYHAKQLEEDPKAKTLSTPYGKSKSRATKESPDKADESQILKFVEDNGLTEFIKHSLKWSDLKKSLKIVEVNGVKVAVDENGQQIPGVVVKPGGISYSVEV